MLERMERGIQFYCMSSGMTAASRVRLCRVGNGSGGRVKPPFGLPSSICGRALFDRLIHPNQMSVSKL